MKSQVQQPKTETTVDIKAGKQAPVNSILKEYVNVIQREAAKKEEPLQKKENNTGLPDNLKSGIENLSGYSLDDVKVHYNSAKPAQLQAHAYAQGTDIHIAPGQEKHLPHEAWHVVQQKQGRVKPTMQMQGVNVNDDSALEKEADVMGGRVMQMGNLVQLNGYESSTNTLGVLQRISNKGLKMESVEQSNELFVRSNDNDYTRTVFPGDMTYHHVIPRKKLADFWNKVQGNNQLIFLTGSLQNLVTQAIARKSKGEYGISESTIFEVNGIEQNQDEMFLTIDKLSKLDYGDLTDIMNPQETNVAHIIEKIYQWWPANLHHGPTSRPTIDPETDDGGDAFEESAKYILDKTRFNLLRKTNNLIDQYQGGKPGIKILKNINGLIIQLSQYKEITKFKPKKWYQISHGALKKKWRVYKN